LNADLSRSCSTVPKTFVITSTL